MFNNLEKSKINTKIIQCLRMFVDDSSSLLPGLPTKMQPVHVASPVHPSAHLAVFAMHLASDPSLKYFGMHNSVSSIQFAPEPSSNHPGAQLIVFEMQAVSAPLLKYEPTQLLTELTHFDLDPSSKNPSIQNLVEEIHFASDPSLK